MNKMVVNFARILLGFVMLWPVLAYPCGLEFTFRAYSDRRFWQPFSKYEKSLEIASSKNQQAADERKQTAVKEHVYAGMSTGTANEAVSNVRNAYRNADFVSAKTAIAAASNMSLSIKEQEELLLIAAKIDIREGEKEPRNKDLLLSANVKLKAFLEIAKMPSWRSEARGWLARTHYLLDDFSSAAKIYLDDLSKGDSVYSRESLVSSLRILFPYNGSSVRLADHLEEYFDTLTHALFVVNIVTNPIYSNDGERAAMGTVAQKVIDALNNHEDLFKSGGLSDQLALTLMRTSMYRGDTRKALSYARRISDISDIKDAPEYNWMVAACYWSANMMPPKHHFLK